MKCYEVTQCSQRDKEKCYVWNSFRETPDDFEKVKCWVLKGAYQQENKAQLKKCQKCKYFIMMNRETGVASDFDADLAVITCEGVLNNDRTKALEKVWDDLKKAGKYKVLLRMKAVSNIYSCGLGIIIKIHKESSLNNGMLVVEGVHGYVETVFTSARLDRILNRAKDIREAKEFFETLKTPEPTVEGEPVSEDKIEPNEADTPKERPPCYVYWQNNNPHNANNCDDCFKKIKPSEDPCWIVEGVIEGVSFQYVNEDCEQCPYFKEFGSSAQVSE